MAPDTAPPVPGFSKVACDQCHRCKLRCSRELPQCERCTRINSLCTFSTGKPIGKPRGSKNRNPRQTDNPTKRKVNPTPFPDSQATQDHQRVNDDQRHAQKDISPQSSSSTSFPSTGGLCDTQNHATGRDSLGSYSTPGTGLVSPSIRAQNLPTIAPLENRYITSPSNTFSPSHNVNATGFQHESQSTGASIEAPSSSCTCSGFVMSYLLSILQEALQQPVVSMLDRSLTLLHNSLQVCENSLKCWTCRHNSGALLFLSFIHRAMSHYGKILSAVFASQPGSSPRPANGDFGVVVAIGGLEVDRSLRERILEAVVRTEMRAGVNLLIMCEQILSGDDGNKGGKMSAMEAQLASALREEFENYG